MTSKMAGWLVMAAVLVLAAAQMGYYWPQLPPRVASQFDFQGNARGWMPKTSLVLVQGGVMLSMAMLPLLVGWLVHVLPPSWVNMPHKDYWLAPERRQQTAAAVSTWLVWMFAATALLLLGIFQLVCMANVGRPHAMRQAPLWLLGGYAIFVVFWLIGFYRRFRRPKEDSPGRRGP